MASTSHIEIKRDALKSNVDFIRSLCKSNVELSAVVKGNAYGHGVSEIIPLLQEFGVTHFSVYSSAEAREAKKVISPESTVMIMGYIAIEDLDWVLKNGVEFFVSSPVLIRQIINRAGASEVKAKIHLEVETGMYRTGLSLAHLNQVVQLIEENRSLFDIKGVASHLAGAESIANYKRIKKQVSTFRRRIKYLEELGWRNLKAHISSSAGLINYPDAQFDMVRTGILLYGYWPTRETQISYLHRRRTKEDPLRRIMKWQSEVMQVKRVPEGEFIGYGLHYQTDRKMRTMVVPVGYCNGYSRSLSNNGHVVIRGQRSPVIGFVNMNMIICDVTEIPGVKVGDKVTLIGQQEDVEITFTSFADMNNAMNYEILARLPENIERIVN